MSLEALTSQLIQEYRAASGEADQNLSGVPSDSYDGEGPGVGRQIAAGFHQGTGIVGNTLRYLESTSPGAAEKIYSVIPGLTDKGDLDSYYGVDFDNPYLTSEFRREIISRRKAEEYEAIFGDVEQAGFWFGLGEVGGSLVDPTTAIPGVGIWKAGAVGSAAIWGALYGGADAAARSLAEQGAIDMASTVISAGMGAAIGGAAEKLIVGPIQNLLNSKMASGSQVDPNEIKNSLLTMFKGTEYEASLDNINYKFLSDELNVTYLNKTPEEGVATFTYERDTGKNMWGSLDQAMWDYKLGKYDEFVQQGTDAFVPPVSPFKQSLAKDVAEYRKIQKEARGGNQSVQDAFLLKKYREANPTPKNQAMADAFNAAWAKQRGDAVPEIADARAVMDDMYLDIFKNDIPMDTVGAKIIQDASILKTSSGNPRYNPENATAETLWEIIHKGDLPYLSETADILSPKVGKAIPIGPAFDSLPEAVRLQGGRNFIAHMLGAKYGGKPRKLWAAYGPAGQMMNRSLAIAEANKRMAIGNSTVSLSKVMSQNGIKPKSVEAQLATDVVRKLVDRSKVSPKIAKVADEIERQLAKTWDDLYSAGVVDQKTYTKYKEMAKTKGYVNRVYDDDYLSSAAGKKEWVDTLSSLEIATDAELKKILGAILGEKSTKLKMFTGKIVTDPVTGKRTLPAIEWAKINNLRKMSEPSRSKFVDNERELSTDIEGALSKFLVSDPEKLMYAYMDDVQTRLQYAKVFGPNDELANALIKKIEDVADPGVAKQLQNVYWDAVKDPQSENIQNFVNTTEGLKRLGTSLRSFEILKLAFAQLLNLGQPITVGTLKLTANPAIGSIDAFAISLKGIVNGTRAKFGNQELREVAERSGAANQALIANYIGSLNETHLKIIPRRDLPGGAWNPLNTLNNPQEFLRVTGFHQTDHLAKLQAFYQGKAGIEHMMDKKAKLLAKGNRANPKALRDVDDALEELGISRDLTPDQVTIEMVERGAAMFSDQINFTPSANEIPSWYNSFFGKISRQFSTFAFNAGSFIGDNIIVPLTKGNAVPLITFLGVLGPGVGIPLDSIRRMLSGDDREFTMTEKYLRGVNLTLGMGILMDTFDRAGKTPLGLAGALLGPGGQDVSSIAYGASKSITQSMEKGQIDFTPLIEQAKGVIPQANRIFKESKEEKLKMDNHYKNQFNDF